MMFYPTRSIIEKDLAFRFLNIISLVIMIIAIAIFIYFFITGNFHPHYIITIGCFWLLFCGILIWLNGYLAISEKSIELTFERTSKQVKKFSWLSLGAFYGSGICFFAGLILFAQKGDIWRNSIIFFAGSVLGLVISMYSLIQRKITKQHYELKKQQQEIIELLGELKLKEMKDVSDVLLV